MLSDLDTLGGLIAAIMRQARADVEHPEFYRSRTERTAARACAIDWMREVTGEDLTPPSMTATAAAIQFDLLPQGRWLKLSEIAKIWQTNASTAKNHLNRLRRDGRIEQAGQLALSRYRVPTPDCIPLSAMPPVVRENIAYWLAWQRIGWGVGYRRCELETLWRDELGIKCLTRLVAWGWIGSHGNGPERRYFKKELTNA